MPSINIDVAGYGRRSFIGVNPDDLLIARRCSSADVDLWRTRRRIRPNGIERVRVLLGENLTGCPACRYDGVPVCRSINIDFK